jgi:hypothetical protein
MQCYYPLSKLFFALKKEKKRKRKRNETYFFLPPAKTPVKEKHAGPP